MVPREEKRYRPSPLEETAARSPEVCAVAEMLRRIAGRGTDVRLDLGSLQRAKVWPREALHPGRGRWRESQAYGWQHGEHINVLEGISLVRAAERVSESQGRLGKQHLILTASQGVLGVVQKGRSSVPRLNRFARRLAALSLGYRQHFLFRWISTKINPADGPSRSFG